MKLTIEELIDKSIPYTDGKIYFCIGGQTWRAKTLEGHDKVLAFITMCELKGEYKPDDDVAEEDIGPLVLALMYDDPERMAAHIKIAESVKEMLEKAIAKHKEQTT
jgi:hypothetical protein